MTSNAPAPDSKVVATHWLRALTEGCGEIVTLLDERGVPRFLTRSDVVARMLGYQPGELAEALHMDLVHPQDRTRVLVAMRKVMHQPGARRSMEYRIRHQGGHWVPVESTAVNRLNDPVVASVVVHTRLRQVPEQAPSRPSLVPQEHLHDRATFTAAVAMAITRSHRDEEFRFAVLMLELERVKMLVASYGTETVDAMIGEAGQRLVELLRPEDTLASLGAGEFGVLLHGVSEQRDAARVAERIQELLSKPYRHGDSSVSTSAVVGIATSERGYEDADAVIRDASTATLRARRHGRKRRAIFKTQMRLEDTNFMSLVAHLHGALQKNEFILHYQPIVDLASGNLRGFEALIRWQHPKKGLIPPGKFVPIAEEVGLVVPMGRWALQEACRQLAEWHQLRGRRDLYVSVNLSAKQIIEEEITDHVAEALQAANLPAEALRLELTESAVIENRDVAVDILKRLKASGVKLSLDDFGTGYSSFAYLLHLPYDTIKIDRSFVMKLGEGESQAQIIRAILGLAYNLHMGVVAEGVETLAQAEILRHFRCPDAQGYYFARPLSADDATKLILTQSPLPLPLPLSSD